jgi:lipoate synthase
MKLSMNFSNLLKAAVTVLFSMAVLTSCNKDDLEKGGATIIFLATYPDSGNISRRAN